MKENTVLRKTFFILSIEMKFLTVSSDNPLCGNSGLSWTLTSESLT